MPPPPPRRPASGTPRSPGRDRDFGGDRTTKEARTRGTPAGKPRVPRDQPPRVPRDRPPRVQRDQPPREAERAARATTTGKPARPPSKPAPRGAPRAERPRRPPEGRFPSPAPAERDDAPPTEAPGRGRDRRGSGDPRAGRTPEAPPTPTRTPRPSQAAVQRDAAPGGTLWLYGLHAVAAALANPRRRLRRLFLTTDAEAALAERLPKPWRLAAERVERTRFHTFLPEDAIHQGTALLAEPLNPIPLDDAIGASTGPVLVLDQVTDPRNVGAILRSAAAFGAACVVMQDRHAPPETGALARAASGALELVPIAREVNLSRAIMALQKAGFWVLGLAGEGRRELAEAAPRDRRTVFVLGAEDAGLRRLQRETCDELVRLPMAPGVESLNVAAAAAVALYEIARAAAPPAAEDAE